MTLNQQNGIALFTTLILLLIVSLASVVLLRNAAFENKITGAFASKPVAMGEVNGSAEKVLDTARKQGNNPFIKDEAEYLKKKAGVAIGLKVKSDLFGDVKNTIWLQTTTINSGRKTEADSQIGLSYRMLSMHSDISYSRAASGQSGIVIGVRHPVLY